MSQKNPNDNLNEKSPNYNPIPNANANFNSNSNFNTTSASVSASSQPLSVPFFPNSSFAHYSEKTQRQLEGLKANGLPSNWFIGKILEMNNHANAQAQAIMTTNPNPALAQHLQEISHLQAIPMSVKLSILNTYSTCSIWWCYF